MQRSLRGRASKIVAAIEANANLRPVDRLKKRDAVARAETLSPWRGTMEYVEVRAKRKPSGGERLYLAFGWESRVLQEQVGHAIQPFLKRDDRCFLQRGVDHAVRHAIALMRDRDWRWIIEADITNFYPSIGKEEVARLLPVDGRISHVVITSDHANPRYTYPRFMKGCSTAVHALTAFRGLPQGARTSPAVADAFVAQQLAKLSPDFATVNFGDNFLVGGRTRREALQNFEALVAAFGGCSNSQLTVVQKQLRRCDQGFKFLGYQLRMQRHRTIVGPQDHHLHRAILQFDRILNRADGPSGPMKVWHEVSSRIGSFSLWQGAASWSFRMIQVLARYNPKRSFMARLALDRLKEKMRSQMML
ncbi:reverse transcriptase domain-containing protein [Sphingobium amiense]|uniref:reverse transcriptase domain-containing protein n=1 Tax=Sphingobium amiense TaxID=135719 RepID=UPI0013C31C60|nr:reverse transcriptase domain-containing protein [Sphingobium amiense]